jgi:hypothetical protein
LTGGFLLAVIAVVLAIVIAAPQYAEPAVATSLETPGSIEPALTAETGDAPAVTVMTSDPPNALKGYRWPVRGGLVDTYYGHSDVGQFEISGKRVHDGLVITWSEGAPVKAAHKGTVVAVGRGWVRHVGFEGPLDEAIETFERRAAKKARNSGKGKEPERFPLGVVIDDGNGYYSVYTELKEITVKARDAVKAGQTIGQMSRSEGKQMMRYRLVRMDGPPMKVHQSARDLGYPRYARERVDPLAVLKTDATRMPRMKRKPPAHPPRLSDYEANPAAGDRSLVIEPLEVP